MRYTSLLLLLWPMAMQAYEVNKYVTSCEEYIDPNEFDEWSETRCPASQTCSPNGFSGSLVGCCPFPDAVACDSGFACCPEGTKCRLVGNGDGYSSVYSCDDEAGVEISMSKCPCKPGMPLPPSDALKNVLIIGDSLSIGFTPLVAEILADVALVQHAPWDTTDGGSEESAYFQQCLDNWLRSPSGIEFFPDVLYFNSGMHNLVVNSTIEDGSSVPGQSGNTTVYKAEMANITKRLVEFAAKSEGKTKLIYGLTTPFLCSVETDNIIANTLNADATEVMKVNNVSILDTHQPILDQCGAAPVTSCFGVENCYCPHCSGGYDFLANNVIAPAIMALLINAEGN